jgi:hypothetical protein
VRNVPAATRRGSDPHRTAETPAPKGKSGDSIVKIEVRKFFVDSEQDPGV